MRKILNGFTIVELLIVVAIIGVLTTIGIISYSSLQSDTRDSQRSSKITLLSEALEKYYDKNGTYPICAALTTAPDLVATNVLKGIDPDLLTTPTATKGVNSISCSDPTPDTFAYMGGGNEYTLKYKEEGSGITKSLESRHRVATTSVTYTLTLVASNGGTVSGGGTFASGSTGHTITATANPNYSFSSWTGSPGCPGTAIHDITMDGDANKTCTANFSSGGIATPSTPVVTPSTVGSTTTFSWPAASCGGNSARYQYRYTVSPAGYDSGLVATAATAIGFTTSTGGQTYSVAVQAECYNAVTSSGMSVAGLGNYDRPFTLTYVAGANCSLTGNTTQYVIRGGNGTAVTVNPATYYSFGNAGSSWTGGSIANPRTDTNITANITVTANCMPTIITPPPPPPTVTLNTVGATTTWSWGAASCPGNTAGYQYRHTNTTPYDSGWVGTSATSVAFTTSTTGITYTVEVQAKCYNTATSSAWSGIGSASFSHGTITYTTGSGSWQVPVGVTSVTIYTWGAGGADDDYSNGNGSGGGGGGFGKKTLSVTPGSTYYYSVGAASSTSNGGDSWFNSSNTETGAPCIGRGGEFVLWGGGGPDGAGGGGTGDVVYNGGNGGDYEATTGDWGGGGGGGAGSSGNGGNGGNGSSNYNDIDGHGGGGTGGSGTYPGGDGWGNTNPWVGPDAGPYAPGGGGGDHITGAGAAGQIILTW